MSSRRPPRPGRVLAEAEAIIAQHQLRLGGPNTGMPLVFWDALFFERRAVERIPLGAAGIHRALRSRDCDEGLPFRRIIEQLGQRQDDKGGRRVPDALARMARHVQAAAHSMRPIWLLPLQANLLALCLFR